MLAVERRNLILDKIQKNRKVIVSELSKEFDVSEETIRRDLDKLSEEGHVIKSYGGAVINDKGSIDLPFNVRKKSNPQGKQKIAQLVKREIADGDHIILDASSTAVFIAKDIKEKENLTVITNSIENLIELSDVQGWDIISTGGNLDVKSMALVGKKVFDSLKCYNADKLFFSCKGLDFDKGVTDSNSELGNIKQEMIASARKVYLVVDSSKFEQVAFANICSINKLHVVITDKKPSQQWLDTFNQLGIQCIYE